MISPSHDALRNRGQISTGCWAPASSQPPISGTWDPALHVVDRKQLELPGSTLERRPSVWGLGELGAVQSLRGAGWLAWIQGPEGGPGRETSIP